MALKDILEVGKSYYIRALNHNYVGRLKEITDQFLVLEDASWIVDDNRFHVTLKDGTFCELEPYKDDVYVSRKNICDITEFTHPLPREPK
jgi:hypothetical protein